MNRNLDQIRAADAIAHCDDEFKGVDGGGIVKKIPPMIRDNGFLGALAFAVEQKGNSGNLKNPGHHHVFECILEHLKTLRRVPEGCGDPRALMKYLCEEADSAKLRDVTTESLLYMNYLRRFVKSGKDD